MAGSAVNLTGMLNSLAGSFQNAAQSEPVQGLLTNLVAQTTNAPQVNFQDPNSLRKYAQFLQGQGKGAEAVRYAQMAQQLEAPKASEKPSEMQVFDRLTEIVTNPKKYDPRVVEAAKIKLKLMKGAGNEVSQQIHMIGGVPHRFDPNTGVMVPVKVQGQDVTADTVAQNAGTVKGGEAAGAAAIERSEAAFDKLAVVNDSISNIDAAIAAIDKGAKTGAVQRYLPSVRSASVELDNVQKRMGLDVIGMGKFGPLSEGELKLALTTAIPTGLDEKELREWLVNKKEAQTALKDELSKMATFLGTPGNTTAGYLKMLESEQKDVKSGGSIGRFKVTKVAD